MILLAVVDIGAWGHNCVGAVAGGKRVQGATVPDRVAEARARAVAPARAAHTAGKRSLAMDSGPEALS